MRPSTCVCTVTVFRGDDVAEAVEVDGHVPLHDRASRRRGRRGRRSRPCRRRPWVRELLHAGRASPAERAGRRRRSRYRGSRSWNPRAACRQRACPRPPGLCRSPRRARRPGPRPRRARDVSKTRQLSGFPTQTRRRNRRVEPEERGEHGFCFHETRPASCPVKLSLRAPPARRRPARRDLVHGGALRPRTHPLQITAAVRTERARDAVTAELEPMRRGPDCAKELAGHSVRARHARRLRDPRRPPSRPPARDVDEPTREGLLGRERARGRRPRDQALRAGRGAGPARRRRRRRADASGRPRLGGLLRAAPRP